MEGECERPDINADWNGITFGEKFDLFLVQNHQKYENDTRGGFPGSEMHIEDSVV